MQYIPPPDGNIADPNRSYLNANPSIGFKGSIIPAQAIEHSMREILAVIVAAGLDPSEADLTQLLEAIQIIVADGASSVEDASQTTKGIVELSTGAELLAGTSTTHAVTPASLTEGMSLLANGIARAAGGLIYQWGASSGIGGDAQTTVAFPNSFPTACLCAVATAQGNATSVDNSALIGSFSATSLVLGRTAPSASSTTGVIYWFAVGK